MSVSGVDGMAVAAVAAGGILIWSGIKGASVSKTFQSILSGQQPSAGNVNAITASYDSSQSTAGGSTSSSSGNQAAPSGTSGSNQAVLQQVAASFGWTGAEWTALYNVEMAEAGFSLTATNPSSGAYGMAQFIDGPSEYAQYGGNSTTALGQATAMCNYIKQRYGTPSAAWAHEQANHWY